MSIRDMIEGKKKWRAHVARVKALPRDYQIAYKEIQNYLFKVGPVDLTEGMGVLSGIVDLFEEQVKVSPNSVAIQFDGKKVTYGELNDRSNQLAYYLKSKGIREESVVPVCLERGLEMIVALLGILSSSLFSPGVSFPAGTVFAISRNRRIVFPKAPNVQPSFPQMQCRIQPVPLR